MIDHEKNQNDFVENETEMNAQEDGREQESSNKDKEMYLRLNADFQNFKRRVEKERIEWMESAQISVLEKLIPVFDEFERALALAEKQATAEMKTWLEGFVLMQKNLQKNLQGLGVKEISTQGEFNPALHEALMHEASTDKKAGEIVQVFSKGYQLKDKVIQHAKVSVAQ